MTEGERASFNEALNKVRKHNWERSVLRKLQYRLDALGLDDTIALLRKIEALL